MEFRDLKMQYKKNEIGIDKAIKSVLEQGDYINGREVKILESNLANYVGVKNCISCANGTDALTLVLMAWEIKEGDAVFVPNFTFFASGEVVSFQGATPIFVDVDERTFNICPKKLREAIETVIREGNLNPKVIIPVDLFGLPADYQEIEKIAKEYQLKI
ncbi:MAG: aminotransferase class I/II-fold pyridoxal phosphate-dependent enzyme, partial [Bacilli bacterium]